MKRVVAVGGGTGMPVLIKSLLEMVDEVTAIVTVADDGGSSGELRREFNILPPGDSRNCLVAMTNGSVMSQLFQYRFGGGAGLENHALGNLIISALVDLTGDFNQALSVAGDLIGARGRVLPSSLEPLTLYADVEPWSDNVGARRVVGQCNVANRLRPLKSIGIEPNGARANPEAVTALGSADVIFLGPGSLFTSVVPNLLVRDMAEAVLKSPAKKIFLCNITIQPGETDGFTAADHIRVLRDFVGPDICDVVVTSNTVISEEEMDGLRRAKSLPIVVEDMEISGLDVDHLTGDLTAEDFPTHHDSHKLTLFLKDLFKV